MNEESTAVRCSVTAVYALNIGAIDFIENAPPRCRTIRRAAEPDRVVVLGATGPPKQVTVRPISYARAAHGRKNLPRPDAKAMRSFRLSSAPPKIGSDRISARLADTY